MRTKAVVVASVIVVGLSYVASAAGQFSRASPHERIDATIGGASLSITYGRPYMRGRTIMGSLVPFDHVWCPGADEATTLTTSKPIAMGTMSLAAGEYTLWMLPSVDQWQLVVSSRTGVFHTDYSPRWDLGRLPMQKRAIDQAVEQLTFAIAKNVDGAGGAIEMTWENTAVSMPFRVVE